MLEFVTVFGSTVESGCSKVINRSRFMTYADLAPPPKLMGKELEDHLLRRNFRRRERPLQFQRMELPGVSGDWGSPGGGDRCRALLAAILDAIEPFLTESAPTAK
jgi:hypothetical protein